jgi:hypothetical protein
MKPSLILFIGSSHVSAYAPEHDAMVRMSVPHHPAVIDNDSVNDAVEGAGRNARLLARTLRRAIQSLREKTLISSGDVQVIYEAPLMRTRLVPFHYDRTRDFPITDELLQTVTQAVHDQEVRVTQQSSRHIEHDDDEMHEGAMVLGSSIVQVKLNGYVVEQYRNRMCRQLDGMLAVQYVDQAVYTACMDEIMMLVPSDDIVYETAESVMSQCVKKMFHQNKKQEDGYMTLWYGDGACSYSLIRSGLPDETGYVLGGLDMLVQSLMQDFHIPHSTALSLIRMSVAGHIDDLHMPLMQHRIDEYRVHVMKEIYTFLIRVHGQDSFSHIIMGGVSLIYPLIVLSHHDYMFLQREKIKHDHVSIDSIDVIAGEEGHDQELVLSHFLTRS